MPHVTTPPALAAIRDRAKGRPAPVLPWWARELRELREQLGLSAAECARQAQTSITTWHNVEHAKHTPNVALLEQMLAVVGGELEIMQP